MSSSRSKPPTRSGGDQYFRPHEIAARFGVSRKVILRLLGDGRLRGFKLGRCWLIAQSEFERYLADVASRAAAKDSEDSTDSTDSTDSRDGSAL